MGSGITFRNQVFQWKNILLVSAIGNITFGGLLFGEAVKEGIQEKEWYDWAGAAFFFIYIFLNLFSAVNVYFFKKLVVHLFMMIIYGFDAVLTGLFFFVLGLDFFRNIKNQAPSDIVLGLILPLVFLLSIFSVLQLMWRLEKTEKGNV